MNDWVTIVPISGTGDGTSIISFNEYTGETTPRTMKVTASTRIGGKSSTLYFNQYTDNITGETNVIRYSDMNDMVVGPTSSSNINEWGANLISNRYISSTEGCIITFDGPITRIPAGAFSSCRNLWSLTIPNSVYFMGMGCLLNAMQWDNAVLKLPSSLVEIGKDIFSPYRDNSFSITYNGTISQWYHIKKNSNTFPGLTVIHCTDGDIEV